ncbi:unnamed protein product [Gongylonema pulchrum]|uniref:Beta-lactamase domain-containing protein n=1 Tax=Gongylonema pulchrum TaxID=637853 RepID=A0A183EIU9_9BILA|nr:unnamed protein product [Gongylonema pulchrum]
MTVVFSSTKAIGALIIAILVSRGHLHYEDKAGLISFDGELSIEQARDHQYVSRLIENTKPKWPAGTETGYHAITFGWLLDQLVRRADPAKRSLAQFYREEIQQCITKC